MDNYVIVNYEGSISPEESGDRKTMKIQPSVAWRRSTQRQGRFGNGPKKEDIVDFELSNM